MAVQHGAKLRHLGHGAVEVVNADAESTAADLHEIAKRRGFGAEQGSAPGHAFAANQPHLDGSLFAGVGQYGYESVLDEIKMFDGNLGVLQDASGRERNPFKQ